MQIVRSHAFARAGLLGNPSDGYHGRTISVIARNFRAAVTLYEWEEVEILPAPEDHSRFASVEELVEDVRLHGYYGGIRLVKATIKRFVEFCRQEGIALHRRNFSVRYESTIPRQVGLAGSSAIVVATLRALMQFYAVQIPRRVLPSLALSVETDELGITAGLQDRVVQVYEGVVYMDFTPPCVERISGLICGTYEPLDSSLLPPLYLAYRTDASEPTEVFHNNLRARFEAGESAVVQAMHELAELARSGRRALLEGDVTQLERLIDRNFDLRASICRLPPEHVQMVETARDVGACAKFAGSGGAIVGIYRDAAMLEALSDRLGAIGCKVVPLRT
ncbi:MAG: GHMP kinase [Planctomycetota bacterium]|nr:MAG: GHMP kinase [Planctomycetota bacterium]